MSGRGFSGGMTVCGMNSGVVSVTGIPGGYHAFRRPSRIAISRDAHPAWERAPLLPARPSRKGDAGATFATKANRTCFRPEVFELGLKIIPEARGRRLRRGCNACICGDLPPLRLRHPQRHDPPELGLSDCQPLCGKDVAGAVQDSSVRNSRLHDLSLW